METNIRPEVERSPGLKEIVDLANPVLRDAIGDSADRVVAEWELRRDEIDRPVLRLRLSDPFGEAVGEFAPKDLQPPEKARRRFYRLWGDLLQNALRKQIRVLETITADQDGGN